MKNGGKDTDGRCRFIEEKRAHHRGKEEPRKTEEMGTTRKNQQRSAKRIRYVVQDEGTKKGGRNRLSGRHYQKKVSKKKTEGEDAEL